MADEFSGQGARLGTNAMFMTDDFDSSTSNTGYGAFGRPAASQMAQAAQIRDSDGDRTTCTTNGAVSSSSHVNYHPNTFAFGHTNGVAVPQQRHLDETNAMSSRLNGRSSPNRSLAFMHSPNSSAMDAESPVLRGRSHDYGIGLAERRSTGQLPFLKLNREEEYHSDNDGAMFPFEDDNVDVARSSALDPRTPTSACPSEESASVSGAISCSSAFNLGSSQGFGFVGMGGGAGTTPLSFQSSGPVTPARADEDEHETRSSSDRPWRLLSGVSPRRIVIKQSSQRSFRDVNAPTASAAVAATWMNSAQGPFPQASLPLPTGRHSLPSSPIKRRSAPSLQLGGSPNSIKHRKRSERKLGSYRSNPNLCSGFSGRDNGGMSTPAVSPALPVGTSDTAATESKPHFGSGSFAVPDPAGFEARTTLKRKTLFGGGDDNVTMGDNAMDDAESASDGIGMGSVRAWQSQSYLPQGTQSAGNTPKKCPDTPHRLSMSPALHEEKTLYFISSSVPKHCGYGRVMECRSDSYHWLQKLGEGSFGVVRKCKHKSDGKLVAVKRSRQRMSQDSDVTAVKKQLALVERCSVPPRCPYIVEVFQAWQESGYYYIECEICLNGNLSMHNNAISSDLPGDWMGEKECYAFLYQMATALKRIHGSGVIHMDIKPDNILVTQDGTLKLGDFGVAMYYGESLGTEGDSRYLAAELLQADRVDFSVDIFALGLSLYELIMGVELPMQDSLDSELWRQIRRVTIDQDGRFRATGASLSFDQPHAKLPSGSKVFQLITRMTHPDPLQRPTAAALLSMPEIAAAGQALEATMSTTKTPLLSDREPTPVAGALLNADTPLMETVRPPSGKECDDMYQLNRGGAAADATSFAKTDRSPQPAAAVARPSTLRLFSAAHNRSGHQRSASFASGDMAAHTEHLVQVGAGASHSPDVSMDDDSDQESAKPRAAPRRTRSSSTPRMRPNGLSPMLSVTNSPSRARSPMATKTRAPVASSGPSALSRALSNPKDNVSNTPSSNATRTAPRVMGRQRRTHGQSSQVQTLHTQQQHRQPGS